MDRAWNYWAAVSPSGNKQVLHIAVQLEAILARFAPANADAYELEPDVTVGALLDKLGIGADEVMLAFVNDKMATMETRIPDRATVTLCPCICGE